MKHLKPIPAPLPMLPRRLYTETEILPATALFDFLLVVLNERRTGSLTINFAGGKPDGTIEFKRRITHLDNKK